MKNQERGKLRISVSLAELLFFAPYILWLVASILSITFFGQYAAVLIRRVSRLSIWVLLAVEGLQLILRFRKFSKREIWLYAAFAVMTVLTYRISRSMAYTMIVIFAGRRIDHKKLIRVSLWVISAVMAVTVVSSQVGLIEDYIQVEVVRRRHFLGFLYTLFPAQIAFNITAGILYLKKEEIGWGQLLLLILFNSWINVMTGSRLAYATALLLILVSAFCKGWVLVRKRRLAVPRIGFLLIGLFLLCAMISFVLSYLYAPDNGFLLFMDRLFEGRLLLSHGALENYGVSLFGQRIPMIGSGLTAEGARPTGVYNYIDNLYVHIFVRYGVIFGVVLMGLFTAAMAKAYRQKDILLFAILSVIALHAIIDDLLLTPYYNVFCFFMANAGIYYESPGRRQSDCVFTRKAVLASDGLDSMRQKAAERK